MYIKRKEFISLTSLAAASMFMPKFLKAFATNTTRSTKGNKVLVVIQLSGGNDGLNTIIPVRNDIYYSNRPSLSIKKEGSISLNDDANIHNSLKAFADLYNEGNLAIMNNVGYPNPDRSHFRSMDIWHTATSSNEYSSNGWLGKYLDAQCHNCDKPTQAMEIDDVLSLALKGKVEKGIAFKDPKRLLQTSKNPFLKNILANHKDTHDEKPVDYLYKVMTETMNSAQYIYDNYSTYESKAEYPNTELAKNLKTIASLIFSDINTSVYYLSLGSFDTHVNQHQQQEKLFTELNGAVESFVKDLKQNNRFDDVLLMTFSEFGRRVSQNASGGTDHGTANNMFFVSGALKQKGFLNSLPNLTDLDDGDLKFNVDFKKVYATVLDNWLHQSHQSILGKHYETLGFI